MKRLKLFLTVIVMVSITAVTASTYLRSTGKVNANNQSTQTRSSGEWISVIENGDAEGGMSDSNCGWSREFNGTFDDMDNFYPASIEEVDGSYAYVVHAQEVPEDEDYPYSAPWQNQFFIVSNHTFSTGEVYNLSFKYKASDDINVYTQVHRQRPGDYLHWAAIGTINFTTEWQEFSRELTVTSEQNGMSIIAFNLSDSYTGAADFYFDDIVWETIETEEGYFFTGANFSAGNYFDFSNTFAMEWDESDGIYIGIVGSEAEPVDAVIISTKRGSDDIFLDNTLNLYSSPINDPDEWIDYYKDSRYLITLPGRGVWLIRLDPAYQEMSFELLSGEEIPEINPNWTTIEMHVAERVENSWDNELWIIANRPLKAGEETYLEFEYVATKEATVGTQCHAEPGQYLHWSGIGIVEFKEYWQRTGFNFTVPAEADGMKSVAINLSDFSEANDYIIYGVVWRTADGYESLIDQEGDAHFAWKTYGNDIVYGAKQANPTMIEVNALERDDLEDEGGLGNIWDNQFFVTANRPLKAGEIFYVEFEYLSAINSRIGMEFHGEPHEQLWYDRTLWTYDYWRTYSIWYEVPEEADGMQTMAFDLAINKEANDYYFRNFIWRTENNESLINMTGDANFSWEVADPSKYVDSIYVINVEKPGLFVDSYINTCGEWDNVRSIKVTGELNEDDLNMFRELNRLRRLDLSEAVFEELPREFMYNRNNLWEVVLPENITTIPYYCFYNCNRLTSVKVAGENKISTVGYHAFQYCYQLSEFDASKVNSVDEDAFWNCNNYDFKSQTPLNYVGYEAFGYSALSEIGENFFSEECTSIPSWMCEGCSQLKRVVLAENISSIGYGAFYNCSSLEEIVLPSSLTNVGSNIFNYCRSLRTIISKSVIPAYADGWFYDSNVYPNQITLYVPAISVDSYREAYAWNAFYNVEPLFDPIDRMLVNREMNLNTHEYEVDVKNVVMNANNFSEFTHTNGIGQLSLEGTGTLSANVVDVYAYQTYRDWGWSSSYLLPTLINEGATMRTDSLNVRMKFYSNGNRWYFISLPFDVKVSDIVASPNTYYVIRKYDGEKRALGEMDETWVQLADDDIMEAGVGYIVYPYNSYGYNPMLSFPALNNENKNNIFRSNSVIVPMEEHLAEFASNRSWNLIGNPYPAYVKVSALLDKSGATMTTPITIWRGYSYMSYSPYDDDLTLRPYESFFVQRPVNQEEIVFDADGRMNGNAAYNEYSYGDVYPGAFAPGRETELDRNVFNFTIKSDEGIDNRARIVINEDAAMEYEVGRDAAKFFTTADNAPLIYVADGTDYEICERPLADGKATLGVQIAADGIYTISLSGKHSIGWNVWLTDAVTGVTTNLSEDDYVFTAKTAAASERFSVVLEKEEITAIETIAAMNPNAEAVITNVSGLVIYRGRMADFVKPETGVYFVTINGKTVKTAIR